MVTPPSYKLNFYPRSPCGERRLELFLYYQGNNFYPRSPCGERLDCYALHYVFAHISIHALLAESDTEIWDVIAVMTISIHALLAESDEPTAGRDNKNNVFLSTLSLRRATVIVMDTLILANAMLFLSTLSLRRATNCTSIGRPKRLYFYPRSPCGERPLQRNADCNCHSISIHALLAESDQPD